jgi:diguanylate cyclase (GGDEF)-like protein
MDKNNSVLIVDDENSNIMTLTHILNPYYKVYASKTGENAIKAAEKYMPDVVLLDILMPGMDGYTVLAALKESEKTRDIPIIFITGLSDAADEEKGLSLGAADYITKPFSPSIVKLRVKYHIKMVEQLRAIEQLSMYDQLTEISNRRNFDKQVQLEWRRAERDTTPISILVLDIDNFKNYNDTYGHPQGDVALKEIAVALKHVLKRATDFVARWGGEEFVVLLPNTSAKESYETAEKIRQYISEVPIPCEDGSITKVTVSIGVNTVMLTHESTIAHFISKADKALYTAKNSGRNRVCVYDDSIK